MAQVEDLQHELDIPDDGSASLPESRRARLTRQGRRARLYTGAVVFVALLAVLIVLITKNTRGVKLDWAIGSAQASLVWIILAAAVIGWLLGITIAIVFAHRTRKP
ncbi:MAG TPA: hypothetical protein VKC62_09500 [Gaiellaceae bacterium]|nr:hypothetical protein [Gaiellaceae bacterium]